MTVGVDSPKIGAGAVVWRGREVLLVQRAKPPLQYQWSLPGGRQEAGETVAEAVCREVREETGIEIELIGLLGVVDAIIRDDAGILTYHYTLIDYSARWRSGEARAASDALAVAWAPLDALDRFSLWTETAAMIQKSARSHGPLAPASRDSI